MLLHGDIYWWHGGSGSYNHVGIYIGNGKMIDCTGPHLKEHSVEIRDVPKTANHERKIIHFDRFPTAPESYFDTKTQTMVYEGRETQTEKEREYNNIKLDGDPNSIIDARFKYDSDGKTIIPIDNVGTEKREYRAVQSACYDGKYFICAQNKAYGGSSKTSNKGGRIAWINAKTGLFEGSIEISEEGKHMDGVAYDCDRNMILKPSSSKEGNLLQIDNSTKEFATIKYTNMPKDYNKLTYVPSIHRLVALDDGKFIIMNYREETNEYVEEKEVKLEDYHTKCGAQGIGTDGQNIFIADSGLGDEFSSSDYRVWTYSLDGKKLEEHKIGSGFDKSQKKENLIATDKGVRNEVESALADNEGNFWLVCPDGLIKAKDYRANPVGINYNSTNLENNSANSTTNEKTNTIETVNFTQDETLMTIDCANIICAGRGKEKKSAHGDMTMIGSKGHYVLIDTSEDDIRDSAIKFLQDKGYADKEFDILISHNHDDHWGNLIYIMKNYKVGTLYLPEGNEAQYAKFEKIAKNRGIKVKRLKQGDIVNIGKAKLEVLYNPHNEIKNDNSVINNKSLVTRISVQTVDGKEIRYLTCGDIEAPLEKELLKKGIDVKADIFKFSHHCMATSNTEEFIDAMQPTYIVSNWWQDTSEQFPRTESTNRVKWAGKHGIVYSVVYNNGVKFSVSAHGVITPEIYDNIENVPYVFQDTQGNPICTVNLQIPKDSHVKSYDPKKELNVEQIQAMQAQIKDYKIVGNMVNSTNQQQGPTKILLVPA